MSSSADGADENHTGVSVETQTLEQQAQALAEKRGAAPAQRTQRFREDPNTEDKIGAMGELAFARAFGFSVEMVGKPHGDGGFDFECVIRGRRISIDLKTAVKPGHLLVKEHEMRGCAEWLVLCQYHLGAISFVGWETKGIMSLMPIADFGYGIRSHFRLREKLRPIDVLVDLLAMRDA